jgi:PIN domain nuclease of toxin-antitoxin system
MDAVIHLDTHVVAWLWAGEARRLRPVRRRIERALAMSWTRDPFDRVISAHARADGVPLLTRDETIRAHCEWAV